MCNLYLQDRRHDATTPRWRGVTLLHEMKARGIPVAVASDNTRDPFYAYGDLDMLEVYRMATRILHFDHPVADWPKAVAATPAEIMRLDGAGVLAAGGPADFIIFKGRSWTELLSRPESDRIVVRDGTAIERDLPDYAELDDLMGVMMDIAALKRDLDGLKIEDNAKIVQQKSRDFYWYSPVLKRQLDHVTADLVVSPKSEAEVIRVLAACHRHGVPVTPRGTGTGNYGQAMPLSGGVVLSPCRDERGHRDLARPRRLRARARSSPTSTGRRARIPARNCGCTRRPTTPPRSAASSPAARAASARSISAACAISAMCSACASSPWRPSRGCSISPARTCTRSPTPTAPTASSPRSRCR